MEIEAAGLARDVWHPKSKIENLAAAMQSTAQAVWVGALVVTVYLLLLPFVERTWRATGDEPHYLLAAHSLVTDRDFDLTNNYAQLDYLNFYLSRDITPQIRLSPGGRQILDHQPGLSVLIAPAYALGGRLGVLIFQAIAGGLLAALTFKLAVLVSDDEMASLLATLFVTLSPPLLMYNYLIYPELIGALLTTLVLYYAVRSGPATSTAFVLTLFSLVSLPWLNRRFVPLALMLVLLIVWAWRREKKRRVGRVATWLSYFDLKTFCLLAATIVSIALLGWFSSQLTKMGEPDITAPAAAFILWDRISRGLVGWLVDQQRGLFVYGPVYTFALWGLPFLVSDSLRRRNRHGFVILPFLLSLGVTTAAGGFWVAWELGPRFLVVALPALAPLLALAWRSYSGQVLWRGPALLLFGLSLANTLVILQNPELPYKSSLPLYYGEKFDLPLTEWLPDLAGYTQVSPRAVDDPTSAQVISENGEPTWLAEPGSPVKVVQSDPLMELPFGHYLLNWPLRAGSGLPPETALLRLSLKLAGGGRVFDKVVTAADLPADGSYGQVQFAFRNPNVDRWRTPPIFSVVSPGQSHIWAGPVLFSPDPFYAVTLPSLYLALFTIAALLAWYRCGFEYSPFASADEKRFLWRPIRPLFEKYWGLVLILPLAAFAHITYQHQQSSRTYEAGALEHFVGQAVSDPQAADGRAWLVDPKVDPPQKAIYGPFDIYDAGRYRVAFRLKLPEAVQTGQELARLQVAATSSYDELIIQPLRLEDFAKPNIYHDFVLTVTNPRRQALSFEVYYLGLAPLLIDRVTISRITR